MSIKKAATFTDEDYRLAAAVAKMQNRSFANFMVHCVMVEARRRKKDLPSAALGNYTLHYKAAE